MSIMASGNFSSLASEIEFYPVHGMRSHLGAGAPTHWDSHALGVSSSCVDSHISGPEGPATEI